MKIRKVHILAAAAEARGTDATGIAYNSGGKLHIYKRPVPAHLLRFRIPDDAQAVMGHTRLTTQGDAKRNYNNHPFKSKAGNQSFALAHNGVLHNDALLRRSEKLPRTKIETDSFVAVQLLQQQGEITFDSLKHMAELMEGSFSFTVLDGQDNLYFIKGDNPLFIYYYPKTGIYLYASTEDILTAALLHIPYRLGKAERVRLDCGDLLRIDSKGRQTQCNFDDRKLFQFYRKHASCTSEQKEYIQELKAVAVRACGREKIEIRFLRRHARRKKHISAYKCVRCNRP